MNVLRTVAKFARLGDLPSIQNLLSEEALVSEAVRLGFRDADRATGRDSLPQLVTGLKIGPGQPALPSIYPESPFRARRKKAA